METLKDQVNQVADNPQTANQLVQEVKDLHGKLYHKVFSLNAENLRLSLKVRNLEEEVRNLGEEIHSYYRRLGVLAIEGTKNNQIESPMQPLWPIESTSLSHETANKKAKLIAMLFLSPISQEFGRALDGIYNILRAK